METKLWIVLAAIVTVGCVAVAGGVYHLQATHQMGQLDVAVHDAPCSDCTHVWVTFQSVAVHESNASGSGWTTLNVSGTTVDLLALNGTAMAKIIGVASLPAGHYEQVRLAVTNVTVMLGNGTTVAASIPQASSADANGAFDLSNGATTTISLDVDLATCLHVVTAGPIVTAMFTPNIGSIVVT